MSKNSNDNHTVWADYFVLNIVKSTIATTTYGGDQSFFQITPTIDLNFHLISINIYGIPEKDKGDSWEN